MQVVHITRGSYRNQPIENTTFPLVKPYMLGSKGGFITVNASGIIEGRGTIRVLVNEGEFTVMAAGDADLITNTTPTETLPSESDEQVIERIAERFSILTEMTEATINGDVRALIVVGPPGVGKSFGVEAVLSRYGLMDDLAGRPRKFEVVKGAMTPIGLYSKLFAFAREGNVLVFDDCDTILLDDLSLNILKAALDSNKKRTIHWNADSALLRREGIPNKFDFKGAVIFITNLKFEHVRSLKLKEHLAALSSRCHYLDLTINTMRDKLLRIKQIAQSGELFPAYGLKTGEEEEIIQFMHDNASELREVSLRMAIKLADLRRLNPSKWKLLAQTTCMKGTI